MKGKSAFEQIFLNTVGPVLGGPQNTDDRTEAYCLTSSQSRLVALRGFVPWLSSDLPLRVKGERKTDEEGNQLPSVRLWLEWFLETLCVWFTLLRNSLAVKLLTFP